MKKFSLYQKVAITVILQIGVILASVYNFFLVKYGDYIEYPIDFISGMLLAVVIVFALIVIYLMLVTMFGEKFKKIFNEYDGL